MINCPTCGRPVPENQRFCGNCGTDIQAGLAYRAGTAGEAPGSTATPIQSGTPGYSPGGYIYPPPITAPRPMLPIFLLVAGVGLFCLLCGIILGGAGYYWLIETPKAATPLPDFTPTPEGLELLKTLLQV